MENTEITDEGHIMLLHALRHEWESDDLDEAGRMEMLAIAMGEHQK